MVFFSCNNNSKSPGPVSVIIIGGDHYVNSVLCPYVEQFSAKSPDWQQYVKFVIIPTGNYHASVSKNFFITLQIKMVELNRQTDRQNGNILV